MTAPYAFIVEDDPNLGPAFAEILADFVGWRVELITNGKEALNRLNQVVPDAILLDVNIPGMRGPELLEHIHNSNGRFAHMKTVLMTADSIVAESMHSQVDMVLVKPVAVEYLLQQLDQLMA